MAALVLFTVLSVLAFVRNPRRPQLAISLVSPPQLQRDAFEFQKYDSIAQDLIVITQAFYRAEVELKNLGPGTVWFPSRGTFELETQTANSAEWQNWVPSWGGIQREPIAPGAAVRREIEIPADAVRCEVIAYYSPWVSVGSLMNELRNRVFGKGDHIHSEPCYNVRARVWERNGTSTALRSQPGKVHPTAPADTQKSSAHRGEQIAGR